MAKLDSANFCTLLVAVDGFYLDKLVITYPTWAYCHPEIIGMPVTFVYDNDQVNPGDVRFKTLHHVAQEAAAATGRKVGDWSYVPTSDLWVSYSQSQREKMLTALVRAVNHIHTPWYLKLDADTYANAKTGFYYDKWFKSDICFIASPWGYTKPNNALDVLNSWVEDVKVLNPELRNFKPVTGPVEDNKVKHPRMASWVMFGRTAWTQWANSLCSTGRLPFPSQDTYLSYLQAFTEARWVPVKFRSYGWEHCRNLAGLKAACRDVLVNIGVEP